MYIAQRNGDALFMDCNKILQSITEPRCFLHQIVWNQEAEPTEYYEMTCKQITSPKFHYVLIHFGIGYLRFAAFRYLVYPYKRLCLRSSEHDNLGSNFDQG